MGGFNRYVVTCYECARVEVFGVDAYSDAGLAVARDFNERHGKGRCWPPKWVEWQTPTTTTTT